ncbi:hypothetical protein BDZ97DRAFT_1929169 [Flammula alnicola]|nr:hypothetical protein BDZ97DRAFT_1929169 [Flammula alnicola]
MSAHTGGAAQETRGERLPKFIQDHLPSQYHLPPQYNLAACDDLEPEFGKGKERNFRELENLLDLIGKASERTLKDQSVVLDGAMHARLCQRESVKFLLAMCVQAQAHLLVAVPMDLAVVVAEEGENERG